MSMHSFLSKPLGSVQKAWRAACLTAVVPGPVCFKATWGQAAPSLSPRSALMRAGLATAVGKTSAMSRSRTTTHGIWEFSGTCSKLNHKVSRPFAAAVLAEIRDGQGPHEQS